MDFIEGVGRRQDLSNSDFIGWLNVGKNSLNGNERNVLFRNRGGATPEFVDVGFVSGADRIEDSRGIASIDVDRDGDLDLVIQTLERAPALLINQGTQAHWLQVQLRGTTSNRDAIGARVEVRVGAHVQTREVTTSSGYISGQSLICHFGLGAATKVDEIRILWPNGKITRRFGVAADQRLELVEASPTAN